MDHEEYLGHSLAEIAAEKAAIIRPNVTTIVAPQTEEVLKIITLQCESVGVEPRLVDFRLYLVDAHTRALQRTFA